MTLDEHIANFLRDGQGRVAYIAIEMDKLGDDGSYRWNELKRQREEILLLMSILYIGDWYISDGYNHIVYSSSEEDWTEKDLILEIERVRYRTEMNELPFINFTGHYPEIVELITGGSGSGSSSGESLPIGNPLDLLIANASGVFVPEPYSNIGGMLDSDSIDSYFAGMP